MPSLAEIASGSGIQEPDYPAIINYLREQGDPVAHEKNPLKVVAPAVSIIHTRARTLQFELTAKNVNVSRIRAVVVRGFNDITKFYSILHGIEPPSKGDERQEFMREREFAEKILDVYYRVLRDIGGTAQLNWEAQMLTLTQRESYSAEAKVLREAFQLPDFAMKEQMARRSGCIANSGWLIFILFILIRTGLLWEIIEGIFEAFREMF